MFNLLKEHLNLKTTVFFLLFYFTFFSTFSKDLNFSHITIDHGLSNNTIECITQDSKGFIWIGTRDGLNRYDGYQILSYKNKANDINSLSDNFIKCIFEDSKKNLWIGTVNGLNKFNADKDNFQRFIFKTSVLNIKQGINSINEDDNGNLLIGTNASGLILINQKKAHQLSSLKNMSINDIFLDKNNNTWLATNNGLWFIKSKSKKVTAIAPFKNVRINVIKADLNHTLWIGTEDSGLFSYKIESQKLNHYKEEFLNNNSIGSNLVRAIAIDYEQNIWIGCINGGLNKLNPKSGIFEKYKYEPGNLSSLSQRTVSALFKDYQGNLWIGTHRGGVNLYSPQAEKFGSIQQKANKNSLSYNDVKCFYEDNNDLLWIGTDGGGLNSYQKNTNLFKHYRYNPFHKNTLGSDAVLDINAADNKTLYISTWGGGLNIFDKHLETFTKYVNNAKDKNSISSNFVQKTYIDSKKNIWVGTYYGGLNLFNKKTKQFYRITTSKDGKSFLSGKNIISIIEDKKQNIWIGTDDGGLNCYNLNTQSFTNYFNESNKYPDLRVLFIDKKGQLWVGQKGLYLFSEKENTFKRCLPNNPFLDEFIKGILEDDENHLWISTANGLIKFNPQKQTLKKYNTEDGLQSLEFEHNAALKTKNGEMFFGGVNGINHFYPKNIVNNTFQPPIYITEFEIFNEKMLTNGHNSPITSDINTLKEIRLSYKQSTFSFAFSALNYIASKNNKYAYKLEGLDKEWNIINKNRKAYYTNLSPGNYTFKVKAANNDDVWSNTETSINIIIKPPFWDTWWFKLIIFLICLYTAYAILSFRRKLELKALEESKKEEMHQMQLQFFTNISHEFRTPLSLILGPIDRLLKEDSISNFNNLYKTIHRNAYRLLGLINELMDFRKVESGALKLKVMPVNINSFLDEIAEEFTELAKEKNIHLEIIKPTHSPNIFCDKQIVEKILLNLINNSVKYTPENGKISLEISFNNNEINDLLPNKIEINSPYKAKKYVYIKITDTGIGISKDSIQHLFERYYRITESHLGSGIGLAFVKSLTLLHKGNITVHSEKKIGSQFIIALPNDKSDYLINEFWIKNANNEGTRLESITNNQYLESNFKTLIVPNENIISTENQINKILIVDDNEELRVFLKESLLKNYLIYEAKDGEEGLEMAKNIHPNLIISDVMMPKTNGIEFCKKAKEDLEISHIPFLMLTAKNSLDAEIEGIKSGADFYFSKPINIDLLLLTIKNIFIQQHKIKEHYIKNYHVQAKEIVNNQKDKDFLDKFTTIINDNLSNPDLDIEFLCTEIGMSRTKLYQKIKAITDQAIGDFIRTIRLRKAIDIMIHEDVLLTEVMYRVGIQTQSYFTKAFKKEFGKTPRQFLQDINKRNINA